jgi:predicted metal-dependent hydrolase
MADTITIGDIEVRVTRKAVKHVHLSVHPPLGRVTLVAPTSTRIDVARAYAISKLGWIREQRRRSWPGRPGRPRDGLSNGRVTTSGGGALVDHRVQEREARRSRSITNGFT